MILLRQLLARLNFKEPGYELPAVEHRRFRPWLLKEERQAYTRVHHNIIIVVEKLIHHLDPEAHQEDQEEAMQWFLVA